VYSQCCTTFFYKFSRCLPKSCRVVEIYPSPGLPNDPPAVNVRSKSALVASIPLGDVVKALESKSDTRLDDGLPFVVRCDGRSFSQFTRGFRKPFDERLTAAMCQTGQDLLVRLNNCCLVYTQSDEITLVFPATLSTSQTLASTLPPNVTDTATTTHVSSKHQHDQRNENAQMFSGRIQKIASIVASLATARFNHHLSRAAFDVSTDAYVTLKTKATGGKPGAPNACSDQDVALGTEYLLPCFVSVTWA